MIFISHSHSRWLGSACNGRKLAMTVGAFANLPEKERERRRGTASWGNQAMCKCKAQSTSWDESFCHATIITHFPCVVVLGHYFHTRSTIIHLVRSLKLLKIYMATQLWQRWAGKVPSKQEWLTSHSSCIMHDNVDDFVVWVKGVSSRWVWVSATRKLLVHCNHPLRLVARKCINEINLVGNYRVCFCFYPVFRNRTQKPSVGQPTWFVCAFVFFLVMSCNGWL